MLEPVSLLSKATVVTADDATGKIADLFFDERDWAVRYLVVDIGNWLFGRTTLISPAAVRSVDWPRRKVTLNLTRKQIEKSPAIDVREPVSRQQELEIFTFYGWPEYWPASGFTSVPPLPTHGHLLQPIHSMDDELAAPAEHFEDRHLRRLAEARACRLEAVDGEVGTVADFLMDETEWTIRYLLVAREPEARGRIVPFPAALLGRPRWEERQLTSGLPRKKIEEAPGFHRGEVSTAEEEKIDSYFAQL